MITEIIFAFLGFWVGLAAAFILRASMPRIIKRFSTDWEALRKERGATGEVCAYYRKACALSGPVQVMFTWELSGSGLDGSFKARLKSILVATYGPRDEVVMDTFRADLPTEFGRLPNG